MSAKTIGYGLILLTVLGFLTMFRCGAQPLYRWSVTATVVSQGLDVASSWGGIEANPVLGRGRTYGWQATAIKGGVVIGCLVVQRWVLRRHPQHSKPIAYVNFGMASATTGVAVRNWRTR